jgi:hypothetical protein
MFGLFKSDPKKKLQKRYDALLLQARDAQRTQGVLAAGKILQEAEEVYKQIQALEAAATER